jgi:uncharacterized protein YbgA (DUF1722 family)/uncharacterized protein YbbK (DUF523 family)
MKLFSQCAATQDFADSMQHNRARIRIGISACLLGENVRYDGGHKHDRYLTQTLGQHFDWVPVCPEVEFGLGTPREPIRLERHTDEIRLVTPSTGRDLTEPMRNFCAVRVRQLIREDLDGYILKSDSPSCGWVRVRVHSAKGAPTRTGRGFFAEALAERFPHLPIEEEGRLCNPILRENWIERVFAYRRIKSLWEGRWTLQSLIAFHTAHKLTLLAHSPRIYRELGSLTGEAKKLGRQELRRRYHDLFMSGLAVLATKGRHANVLQHMAGYVREQLDDESRRELSDLIDDYRNGALPLIVPLTLLKHYVRKFKISYLAGQIYMDPHPKELALRNHV